MSEAEIDRNQITQEDLAFTTAEPWEAWETQLVMWSLGIGIAGLIVLGTLINIFILN